MTSMTSALVAAGPSHGMAQAKRISVADSSYIQPGVRCADGEGGAASGGTVADVNLNGHHHEQACIACIHVRDASRPVLLVTHDEDDWTCVCGGEDHVQDASDFAVVGLDHLVVRDPTLAAILDLPVGWEAERAQAGSPWERVATVPDVHLRMRLPEAVLSIRRREKSRSVHLNHPEPTQASMIHVDNGSCYLRALLVVNLRGGGSVTYGLWVEVSREDLRHTNDIWDQPTYADLSLTGRVANNIEPWGLLDAHVDIAVRSVDEAPYCVASHDDALAGVLTQEWDAEHVLGPR